MKTRAEVVVVGGGSSGAAVAARLAERSIDVILLEAGPDYGPFTQPPAAQQWPADLLNAHAIALSHDWGYGSGPIAGRAPWTFERARVVGGCSAHNGAIAAVGHTTDYDAWGLPEWRTDVLRPIFSTVLKTMRVRAYEQHEAGPFHARCLEAAAALGWKIASDLCDLDANDSFGLETVNIINGIRWNTAFAYLDPVRHLSTLTIVEMTEVERFVEHDGGVTIIAWRYGQPVTIEADRIVLSAGVYGTPTILQRSGIGDPEQLRAAGVTCRHELRGVGANLHDHPMVHADRIIGSTLQGWIEEAAQRNGLPEEQTLGKARSTLALDGVFDLHLFPVCASTQTALTDGNAVIEVACMTPRSRGRVDIVSADRAVAPRIDHAYLTDAEDHDITVLREGLVMADEMLNHPVLAPLLGDSVTDIRSDEALRREVVHYYHPVGTCAMGTGEMSVCDAFGRVHGLRYTTVADASLMPQIPRANTNIPAIMIGERVAGFLASAQS